MEGIAHIIEANSKGYTVLPRIIVGRLLISRAILPENILSYFEKINILENQSTVHPR